MSGFFESTEIVETAPVMVENFKKIKPDELTTLEEAKNFLTSLFLPKETNIDTVKEAAELEPVKEAGDAIEADNPDKTKDLTEEEINDLQKNAISEAFDRIKQGEKLTDAEKGNLGEMLMDQYYISRGYTPIHQPRVVDLAHKSGQGIDGVYKKITEDGEKNYIIADAKVNSSKLNKGLTDGTNQMSDAWIDKRLDNAVGKEEADEIRDAYEDNPENVSREVYHFSYGDTDDGTSMADVSKVDTEGNVIGDSKMTVQIFNSNGDYIIYGSGR